VGIGTPYTTSSLTVRQKTNGVIALGSSDNLVATFEDSYGGYGFMLNVHSTGAGTIQIGDTRNTSNAYALNLQPLGGNVLIGTTTDNGAKLQVNGSAIFDEETHKRLYTRIKDSGIQVGRYTSKYTGGAVFGLSLGYDNTAVAYIAGAYDDSEGTHFFIGGGDKSKSPIMVREYNKETKYGKVCINGAYPTYDFNVAGTSSLGNLLVSGTSTFGGQSTFNALALFNKPIVAKDTLQIGDATLMWDGNKKALVVDKSFASMGEISAGGAGTEGGNTGGGGTGTITNPDVEYYNPKYNATHTFYHNLPYYDVVVQVYEKNAISGAWDMILADVTIANESNLVTVNFGRKEDVEHKIVVR
jgi:hypothetical protein